MRAGAANEANSRRIEDGVPECGRHGRHRKGDCRPDEGEQGDVLRVQETRRKENKARKAGEDEMLHAEHEGRDNAVAGAQGVGGVYYRREY